MEYTAHAQITGSAQTAWKVDPPPRALTPSEQALAAIFKRQADLLRAKWAEEGAVLREQWPPEQPTGKGRSIRFNLIRPLREPG